MLYGVRFARPDELDALPAIEVAADARFAATPYAALVAGYPTTAVEDFAAAQDRWALFVAVGGDDRPVAFAHCRPVGRGTLYVAQLSVHPEHAGRRLASRMLDGAAAFHGPRGVTRLTLTTFRDLPWNAPYYGRIGFREVPDLEAEVFLKRQIEEQVRSGFARECRVAMARPI